MAIAYDNSTDGGLGTATNSLTFAHTVSAGSNRILLVGVWTTYSSASDICSGVTYNGVAMTRITQILVPSSNEYIYLYALVNPASGAHNVVVSLNQTANYVVADAISYTGASQAGQPDASTTKSEDTATLTTSLTTIKDNCWLVGYARNPYQAMAAGTGTTKRAGINNFLFLIDSNGAKSPAGSYSLQTTATSSLMAHIVASIAPAVDYSKTVTETLKIATTFSNKAVRTIAETLKIAEVISKISTLHRTLTETIKLAEGRAIKNARTIVETIKIAEAISKIGTFIRSLSESIKLADTIAKTIIKTLAIETIKVADSISRIISAVRGEVIKIAESISKISTIHRTLTETIKLSEVFGAALLYVREVAETIKMSETFSRIATLSRTISETLKISEAISKISTLSRTFTEAIKLAEPASIYKATIRTIGESVKITENIAKKTVRTISEALKISEIIQTIATYSKSLSEAIKLADSITLYRLFTKTLNEAIKISEEFYRNLLGRLRNVIGIIKQFVHIDSKAEEASIVAEVETVMEYLNDPAIQYDDPDIPYDEESICYNNYIASEKPAAGMNVKSNPISIEDNNSKPQIGKQ